MKFKKLLPALVLAATLFVTGCGPKDSKIQENVNEKLTASPSTTGASAIVTDGVATLTGEVASDMAKTESETIAKGVKGVKSVINNLTVASPVMNTAPVVVATDDTLTTSVRDAVKDHPTVNASVTDGVITLTGEIDKASLQVLMQKLNALQPKKIDNKLTVK